jgi:hypothetical protein
MLLILFIDEKFLSIFYEFVKVLEAMHHKYIGADSVHVHNTVNVEVYIPNCHVM